MSAPRPITPPLWRALAATCRGASAAWRPWESSFALAGAGTVLVGCGSLLAQDDSLPALRLQQARGWNVGDESMPLRFPSAIERDVDGGMAWRTQLWRLPDSLAPHSSRWAPYYAPTLFQVVRSPRADTLRAVLQPIATPAMAAAHERGAAIASLLNGDGGCRTDIAVIVDAPGPESVAAGAALAACLDPVFFFDNWPHPEGVVPSHLTLAATLYYWPRFAGPIARPADPAPLFILDQARLAPYADEVDRFDNRYFARLPSPGQLASAGVRHLLYVVTSANPPFESDDLNEDFVGLEKAGIDVRMVALDNFMPEGGQESGESATLAMRTPSAPPALFFAGSPTAHASLLAGYGWAASDTSPESRDLAKWPPHVMRAWAYRPEPRATPLLDDFDDESGLQRPRAVGAGGAYRSGTIARLGAGRGFG